MTLREAKELALRLMDEESGSEYLPKMNFYADIVQSIIAHDAIPIKKVVRYAPTEDEIQTLPQDLLRILQVESDGLWSDTVDDDGKRAVRLVGGEAYRIIYAADPARITEETDDGYEFPFDPAVCDCIPYGICAQIQIMENDQRFYANFENKFNAMLTDAMNAVPNRVRVVSKRRGM